MRKAMCIIFAALIISLTASDIKALKDYTYPNDGSHPEIRYGSYDGYDLTLNRGVLTEYYTGWNFVSVNRRKVISPDYSICWDGQRYDYSEAVIRIPSTVAVEATGKKGTVIKNRAKLQF